ncbi:NUDIX hydrolase [Fadolivirus algeromassiliense]|jgi:ADP-ribose pyrophosphatase YjhB (NUDIX family)|uniref:NUDIX hydrolase n=1 Tax=Fadolivirus FV1/VV64 TaxID=3070911 RepID=A0A7D3QWR9_9VIRU|nr:NUDIX hydrolase [Fadolivirus algeromassiliense]QKF94806.1 NUDIX hydrolase [Fadolivirus FV1/VV64]
MKSVLTIHKCTRNISNLLSKTHHTDYYLPAPVKPLHQTTHCFAQHCSYCGTQYSSQTWPRFCSCCKNTTFRNPIPVAVGLLPFVTSENKYGLLLTRRNIKPHVGELCFPGGFVDWGESWQQAVSREVREETLVETDPNEFDLMDVHSTPDCTRILIFGVTRNVRSYQLLENFKQTNETSEVLIGNKSTKLCFSLHQSVYDDWIKRALSE